MYWYLFLQLFGTNEFELPTLGTLGQACWPSELSVIILQDPSSTTGENQLTRIEQNPLTKDLLIKAKTSCSYEGWELILATQEGHVKGAYRWDIAEIDRLITEVELYHTIEERNGARDSK